MRKKIVAGNWKMNLLPKDAEELVQSVDKINSDDVEVFIFPPSLYIEKSVLLASSTSVGAQNAHPEKNGAYTGEISMLQCASMGAKAVLVGHSERRALFKESNEFLKKKVDSAIEEGLLVFFCCGETLEERKRNEHKSVVKEQIASALFHLAPDQWKNIVIAYEPVWAIGTGETASSEQAEEMHAFIRNQVELAISKEVANELSILYGGSCKPTNAEELFAQNNIDGGLIGGASLKSADFEAIIKSF